MDCAVPTHGGKRSKRSPFASPTPPALLMPDKSALNANRLVPSFQQPSNVEIQVLPKASDFSYSTPSADEPPTSSLSSTTTTIQDRSLTPFSDRPGSATSAHSSTSSNSIAVDSYSLVSNTASNSPPPREIPSDDMVVLSPRILHHRDDGNNNDDDDDEHCFGFNEFSFPPSPELPSWNSATPREPRSSKYHFIQGDNSSNNDSNSSSIDTAHRRSFPATGQVKSRRASSCSPPLKFLIQSPSPESCTDTHTQQGDSTLPTDRHDWPLPPPPPRSDSSSSLPSLATLSLVSSSPASKLPHDNFLESFVPSSSPTSLTSTSPSSSSSSTSIVVNQSTNNFLEVPHSPGSLGPVSEASKITFKSFRRTGSQQGSRRSRTESELSSDTPIAKMKQIAEWFSDFTDAQRNDTLRMLLQRCNVPQLHLLSVCMEPVLHQACPRNCQDFLAWLPEDVALHILSFLDAESLCRAMQVSRAWAHLSKHNVLWKFLACQPMYRLAPDEEKRQLERHVLPGPHAYHWREVFRDRFRLRRNWLHGRCSIRTFHGHSGSVSCIQFDDTKIASGSSDRTIKVWSIRTNAPWSVLTLRGHLGTVRCLHLMGNQLVSGSNDNTIKVWDLADGPGWSRGSCRLTITGHSASVRCLQADSEKIVSGSYDSTLKVWGVRTGQCEHTLRGHDGAVLALQFDDTHIVSGGMDTQIKIWELKTGTCLSALTGHRGGVTCLHFNWHEGRIFSGALDGDLRFWDIHTGECLDTLDWIRSEGHTGVIRQIQADKWRVISASDDKTIKVWNLRTGQRLVTLQCHTDGVTCIQFNDTKIVSGSFDETIKVLDFSAC
eukprot:m.82899 g.82899  ORF g.82899 m.82899 type:complete len:830 (-) comp21086_c0_seq1:117-2606(-)